jgi:glycosyltransferase involved in cell wall biosynthesis
VLPSSKEPFGRVLIEAMSAELPVIASNSGGGPEIIGDGEDGLLFSAGDYKELASCMLRLLRSQWLREEMGKKGREKVKRKFNAEDIARRYYDIFRRLHSR